MMHVRTLVGALVVASLCGATSFASGEETKIRGGNIDAVLTTPSNVERPPVALLIAGSRPSQRR